MQSRTGHRFTTLTAAILASAALLIGDAALAQQCAPRPSSCPVEPPPCPARPHPPALGGGPLNLGVLKNQLTNYRCFGGYDDDLRRVFGEAKAYVAQRAGEVRNGAIVLDIDETALSNMMQMVANDYGYIPDGSCEGLPKGPCGWQAWERTRCAPAIPAALELVDFARSRGVKVFFVTGRRDSGDEREVTEENLCMAGYRGWEKVFLRPAGDRGPSAAYKSGARRVIEAGGLRILANIGDQQGDLDGGYAERTFLVPNPFYFIP